MVLDSSAVLAIVFGEEDAETDRTRLGEATESVVISAATLVEATIVAEARGGSAAATTLHALIRDLGVGVVGLDEGQAGRAIEAWRRFGKGNHPAALNLGDCFAYALATALGEPLLFKGDDFAQTDVISAR